MTNLSDPQKLRERPTTDVESSENNVDKVPEKIRHRLQLVRILKRRPGQRRRQQVRQLLLVVRRQADGQRRYGGALERTGILFKRFYQGRLSTVDLIKVACFVIK